MKEDKFHRWIKKEIEEEAEALEKHAQENEELASLRMPDDSYEDLMRRIAAQEKEKAGKAAEKAYDRMIDGWRRLQELRPSEKSSVELPDFRKKCADAMNDDLNTPIVIAELFEACRIINSVNDGKATLTQSDIDELKDLFTTYLVDILGIRTDIAAGGDTQVLEPFEKAVDLLLQIRKESKEKKDWATSDLIRNRLAEIGFDVKDTKDGFEWSLRK